MPDGTVEYRCEYFEIPKVCAVFFSSPTPFPRGARHRRVERHRRLGLRDLEGVRCRNQARAVAIESVMRLATCVCSASCVLPGQHSGLGCSVGHGQRGGRHDQR